MKVKTYKGDDGKWYVEIVDTGNTGFNVGQQLDASASIDTAAFVLGRAGCGFSSRRLAREYLASYMADFQNVNITGGLH